MRSHKMASTFEIKPVLAGRQVVGAVHFDDDSILAIQNVPVRNQKRNHAVSGAIGRSSVEKPGSCPLGFSVRIVVCYRPDSDNAVQKMRW